MKILAHRGWWHSPSEKNSETAFVRAFEAGFGVETDIRDQEGELRISHDVAMGTGLMSFGYFLELYRAFPDVGVTAVNVKADGLQSDVCSAISDTERDELFFFDMAVPDALGYLKRDLTTYTRHSEFEPVPAYYELATGVWLDCFLEDWVTPDVIQNHLDAGKKVALVSPELHGRPHGSAWDLWADFKTDRVAICTDLPHLAADKWA